MSEAKALKYTFAHIHIFRKRHVHKRQYTEDSNLTNSKKSVCATETMKE